MKKLLAVLLCLGLAGCATAVFTLDNISLGMTKTEVIKTIGKPDSVSAQGKLEYLTYIDYPRAYYRVEYFVRLVNGKVESYGKVGDFDSTKDLTRVIKVIGDVKTDETVKTQSPNGNGLEDKLNTLNKLLSDGLITKDEFDARKKALLDSYTSK